MKQQTSSASDDATCSDFVEVARQAIKNTDWMMGKKTGVAYAGTIEVVIMPPIPTAGKTVENDLMDLLTQTRKAVAEELAR